MLMPTPSHGRLGDLFFDGYFLAPFALVDRASVLNLGARERWVIVVLLRHEYAQERLSVTLEELADECGESTIGIRLALLALIDGDLLIIDPPLADITWKDTPFRWSLCPTWEKLADASEATNVS